MSKFYIKRTLLKKASIFVAVLISAIVPGSHCALHSVQIEVEGGNEVVNAETSVLTCSYTKSADDSLARLAFFHTGDPTMNPAPKTQIANFLFSNSEPLYPNSFNPPGYVMSIDNIDEGESGSSQLTIDSTTIDDNRRYWCFVSTQLDSSDKSTDVNLTVIVPTQSPDVFFKGNTYSNESSVMVFQGMSSELRCVATAGHPAASLQWELANQPTEPDSEKDPTPNDIDSRLFDTESVKTVIPSFNEHHREFIQCTASQSVKVPSVSTFVGFDVYVPPSDTNDVTISDGSNPSGYLEGATAIVYIGSQHVFTCDVLQTRPSATIEWFIGGNKLARGITTPVPPSDGNDLEDTTGSLMLTPIKNHHNKRLECRTYIDVTDAPGLVSKSVMIDVYGPPDEPTIQGERNIVEETSKTFKCTATGAYPEGGFEWFNGNINITDRAAMNNLGDDSRYEITSEVNVSPLRQHNGNIIKCNVIHETLTGADERSQSRTINVQFCPSTITISNNCPDILENTSVGLSCLSSSSNPRTDLVWSKNEIPLNNPATPAYAPGEYGGETTTLLYTTEFTRENTGSVMKCCGTTDILSCNRCESCTLNVLYPPERINITKSVDGPIIENTQIDLTCYAEGNPVPNDFFWEQDDNNINKMTKSLTFESVSRSSAGYYTCVARNGNEPKGESDRVPLAIHYSPHITNRENNQIGVEDGNDVTMECIANALPRPEFTWIIPDGTELTNTTESDRITVTTEILQEDGVHGTEIKSRLYIDGIDSGRDYGGYTCLTRNGIHPQDSFTIDVIGKAVPNAVSDLRVINTTQTSITVSWNLGFSGGDSLDQTFFIAHMEKLNSEEWTESETNVEKYTLIKLKSGTKYVIRVTAQNEIGRSEDRFTEGETNPDISKSEPINNGAIIGSTMGVIILMLLVIVGGLLIVNHRLRNQRSADGGSQGGSDKPVLEDNEIKHEGNSNGVLFNETSFQNQPDNAYGNVVDSTNFTFPRENLKIEQELGHGEFGKVMKATAIRITPGKEYTTVAVKTLKDTASDEAKQLLIKEFELMKVLLSALRSNMNPNVLLLLGGCIEKAPMYVILEYMPKGDLKSLLRESKITEDDANKTYDNLAIGSKSLTPVQLIQFARDVANGMAFLASQKCIHRDLAARNVLLNEKLECKVSDFGLAQDVMNIEVYQRKNQCRLPIRWMAIESLDSNMHTVESDVWSYGVLLWEIVTLGARPYPRMKAAEIRQMLRTGNRMPQPKHCSEQLYNIMLACWEKNPSKRPPFQQIMRLLDEIREGQMGYLKLSDLESKLYEDTTIAATNEKV